MWDDGEVVSGLPDPVTLSHHRNQAGRTDDKHCIRVRFTPASRSRISAPPPDQLPLLELNSGNCNDNWAVLIRNGLVASQKGRRRICFRYLVFVKITLIDLMKSFGLDGNVSRFQRFIPCRE